MITFYKLLFPSPLSSNKSSLLLLILRIAMGLLLLHHGVQKWIHFDTMAEHFPDPIGIGSKASLILDIFAELFCSAGVIIGFLTRLCLIPMMFTMCIITFVVMHHAPFAQKELPVAYLIIYVILFFAGPGKFSIDFLIGKRIRRTD